MLVSVSCRRRGDAEVRGAARQYQRRQRSISSWYRRMHDGRFLTLEDTVEFFNLVLGVQLMPREKTALVAFVRQL